MNMRSRNIIAILATLCLFLAAPCQAGEKSRLVTNLEAGKKQTVVTYGTSLTAEGAWVRQLSAELNRQYPELATVGDSQAVGHARRVEVRICN